MPFTGGLPWLSTCTGQTHLHLAGLGGRHVHQGPEGAVVDDARDRLALAHVIAELHRIEVADLAIDRSGDELVAEGGGTGAGPITTLDRLGHVVVPVLGGDGPLFVEEDVSLGIDAILDRLGPVGIERRRLLHVVEHQDRLACLHPLPLGGQDAHHTAIRLGPHHHVGGRLDGADRFDAGSEAERSHGHGLNRQGRTCLGLTGATGRQQNHGGKERGKGLPAHRTTS